MNNNIKWEWIKQCNQKAELLDWIRKHDSAICCPQDANLRFNNTNRLKIRRMEKDIACKEQPEMIYSYQGKQI